MVISPVIAGLDSHTCALIQKRLTPICFFLEQHLSLTQTSLLNSEDRQQLEDGFIRFEQHVSRAHANDWAVQTNGRIHWQQQYLLPLAIDLDLPSQVEHSILQNCWQRGWFDRRPAKDRHKPKSDAEPILKQIRAVLRQTEVRGRRVGTFIERKLTRDDEAAQQVALALEQRDASAAALARGLILSFLHYGPIGLLKHTPYPWITELLYLEQQRSLIERSSSQPAVLLDILRQDLLALAITLAHFDLWNQNLLSDIPGTQRRKKLGKLLRTGLRHKIHERLSQNRRCSIKEAEKLLQTCVHQGLIGLIDWRTQGNEVTQSVLRERLQRTIKKHLSALQPDVLQEIENSLWQVQEAIIESGIPFPLMRLLQENPSSPYRIALGRRVWFSAAASLRRRSRRIRKKTSKQQPTVQPIASNLVDTFVGLVAKKLELDENDARQRLRQLITSGGIGMLKKDRWISVIDPRLRNYIHFIKLGHLNGSVDWSRMYVQLNRYAEQLGQAHVSQQLARAIFNNLPKPRRWNGGAGEATARTRQRATLNITDVPLLHQTWDVFAIELDITLLDSSYRILSPHCFAVLVVDTAASAPVGAWLTPTAPNQVEAGLAIYQAIWQPGTIEWPIHGIPQTIQIDQALIQGSLADLKASAEFLLSTIQIKTHPNKRKHRYAFVDRLRTDGVAAMRERAGSSNIRRDMAQNTLLEWLRTTCFPHHRAAPIPAQCRKIGFATTAQDSPAAGWLLPHKGVVRVSKNGETDGNTHYSTEILAEYSGQELSYRDFPSWYSANHTGIFVECLGNTDTRLIYIES
jgi:hypothetical protein